MSKIQVTHVAIEVLKPSEYNPRSLSARAEADLTESLSRFSLLDPLIVNSNPERENIIVGGHQRFTIAKKLGYKTVPVIYVNLTPDKEKELNLRLNKNTGEFDLDLLRNFDMDLLLDVGFDDGELSAIWDDTLETEVANHWH